MPIAVIQRGLRTLAFVSCLLVSVSFAMFVADQAGGASSQAVAEIGSPNPRPHQVSTHHGQPRRFIDGAARTLTAPFRALVHSSSVWTVEIFETFAALLVYGFGLGFLARFTSGLP
jgi:hypothetical protein